ncbi:MAG: hypothetical protein FD122_3756 [Stygiobacter sp.]|nr:MAG: hypothetical protein FD122_3756 [Stygiobacter sp.]
MAVNSNTTGEARKKQYENIYMQEFFKNARDSFQVRVTLIDGTPKIGFSRFWRNFKDGEWYPSKDHFFFKPEVWHELIENISRYDREIGQLGLSGMHLPESSLKHFVIFFPHR